MAFRDQSLDGIVTGSDWVLERPCLLVHGPLPNTGKARVYQQDVDTTLKHPDKLFLSSWPGGSMGIRVHLSCVHTQGDYKVYTLLTWVQVGGWSPLCREHTSPTRGWLSQHTRAEGSGEGLRGYEASKEPERNAEHRWRVWPAECGAGREPALSCASSAGWDRAGGKCRAPKGAEAGSGGYPRGLSPLTHLECAIVIHPQPSAPRTGF